MAVSETTQKKIIQLYLNEKLSMTQIADKLSLSPSAVIYYLDKHKIKRRSISEAILDIYRTKFNKKPFALKNEFSKNDEILKTTGVMLYWGEGNKGGNVVRFSNSDPEMISMFLVFLRRICGIAEERLKALIHCYPDHNLKFLHQFWMSSTGISKKNFYKPYIHKGKAGTYKLKSKYGTLALSYADKQLFQIILGWLEDYKKKFHINKPE